jgi:acetamidase/formamidase
LYIGDAHAAQGDGELNGNALETSMDIEFTVRVFKGDQYNISMPRIEDSTYIMTVGFDESLDNALKIANAGMVDWLQKDYHMTYEEISILLGSTVEYCIAEAAIRQWRLY